MEVTHTQILPGVRLTAIHTGKFKSTLLGVNLLTPLCAQTAAQNALIPMVLRRGTAQHPDMQHLSAALDALYGGSIEPVARKKGETQCVGFIAGFLDDAFAGETGLLERAAALVGDVLLHPVTEQGVFRADYVTGECGNLIDRIRAQKNDKRQYAVSRMIALMCADEAYGTDRFGTEESLASVTPETLWQHYRTLLSTAEIELFYCGSAPPERVSSAMLTALDGLPATRNCAPLPDTNVVTRTGDTRRFTEPMDITQGKLTLGFRTGGVTIRSPEYPALLTLNALYGGTVTSKLFLNVRERLSLCYYAYSLIERHKGVMFVASGVEFAQFARAEEEILAQFSACARGELTAQELDGARRSVVNDLKSALDSQGRLEEYWLDAAVARLPRDPEALARQVEAVTSEAVASVAQRIILDGVYYLTGKEAQPIGDA